MLRRLTASCVLALVVLSFSVNAWAGKYDLDLARLFRNDAYTPTSSNDEFKSLMGDLGVALAPRFLGPAASLGSLGFNLSMDYSMTNIQEDSQHWQSVMTANPGTPGEGADSYLQTMHLHIRKGLPFSAEVGGTFSKLLFSEMWGVGFEFKYSALEGYNSLPELSFGVTVSTYLGSSDFSLLSMSSGVMISKKIGIAGLFKLAPYAGYNFMYIHGGSNVVVTDVKVEPASGDLLETQGVFRTAHVFRHFAIVGLQVVATVVNVGFEASITDSMQVYALRLGVEF